MTKKQTPLDPRIVALEEQLKGLDDQFKRVLADYQNQEKRFSAQKIQTVKFANLSLLEKLLPIIDNLERAQAHLNDQGIKMILQSLSGVLTSEGVTEVVADGQEFDPLYMECVETVAGPDHIVVRTVAKGYRLDSTVIRPAKVEVGNGQVKSN